MHFALRAGIGLLLLATAPSGFSPLPAFGRSASSSLSPTRSGLPEPGTRATAEGSGAAVTSPVAASHRRRPIGSPHTRPGPLPWWARHSRDRPTGASGADDDSAPTILVRLHDPERLLSRPALERLREEAAAAFRRSGAEIRFVDRGGGPPIVPATLYPEIPRRWKVTRGALGVAIGAPDGPRSIFLSVGAVGRALGVRGASRKRGRWKGPTATRFGRALGRVLAHELVHAIAPDCPHTGSGLMSARLTRWMLVSPEADFDETARGYLRRGAAAYGGGRDAPDAP